LLFSACALTLSRSLRLDVGVFSAMIMRHKKSHSAFAGWLVVYVNA
jgi:hypothetical protein